MSVLTEQQEVLEELRSADRLFLTTHENPDGDALGSLRAMQIVLEALGKDSVMFMSRDEFPLPREYRHMPFDDVLAEPPPDMGDRLVVFLDCGNMDRMPVDFIAESGSRIVNIDHHHDNTRFGDVNLVKGDASCTAEIVYTLARELDVEITPRLAEALYIGLVTDTGKFMFENTTPAAHQMAAELIAAGVEPQVIHQRLYEGLPFSRIQLLARALGAVQRFDDGALTLTHLTRDDFTRSQADESDSEGIVDHMRQVEGTLVAGLIRDLLAGDGRRKVSLRATDGRVDVSQIARGFGGGGHRQAAGFTTDMELDELVARLREEVGAQL
ncbi:MAG TPA: bifunctional oligoribonuclease/PAP phosphatase NrnA [Thermoleophilaceae bacterium]|nr:bifunctional oligoribonuclease/PAP phosphatase NrnA [Thermoleophilaceae bacterium]